jgi:hypothetical protein
LRKNKAYATVHNRQTVKIDRPDFSKIVSLLLLFQHAVAEKQRIVPKIEPLDPIFVSGTPMGMPETHSIFSFQYMHRLFRHRMAQTCEWGYYHLQPIVMA